MNPREFIKIAKSLVEEKNPSPAACRTVISRSYYAAFHVAMEIVNELNIPIDKQTGSHEDVLKVLITSNDKTLKIVCDSLARQKKVRKDADYEMTNLQVETQIKASQAVVFAEKVIEQIQSVRSDESLWHDASEEMLRHAKLSKRMT